MKKALIFIAVVVVVGWAAYAMLQPRWDAASPTAQRSGAIDSPDSAKSALGSVGTQSTAGGYRAYANSVSPRAYKQDPVAIEQLVELDGACKGVASIKPGDNVSADVKRLQTFCEGYSPGASGVVDWAKGYSASLTARLDKLGAEQGRAAVAQELAVVLSNANPYEARAALQYAADSGIVPASLTPLVDGRVAGTSVQRDQLEALAQLEFCRRGGGCGPNDFSTISACVVLGPCQRGDTLLSVFRRKNTPENFEMAQKMSRALSNG